MKISSFASNLKNYIIFIEKFDEIIVFGLFLNNVRKSLKVHAVGIKRPKPSCDAFSLGNH